MTVRELIERLLDLGRIDPTVLDHEVLICGDWHALSIISAEEHNEEPVPFPIGDPYRCSRNVVVPV